MTAEEQWQKNHRERVARMPADIRDAHAHCRRNEAEIGKSDLCGCFYCLETFAPREIEDWVGEQQRHNNREDLDAPECARSAICPRCGIDSVIGSVAGFPLTTEFLGRMKSHWF